MSTFKNKAVLFVILSALTMLSAGRLPAQNINPQHLDNIRNAMPDKSPVNPQKPRMVLSFDLSKGFQHGSIPYCAAMLDIMAEKTGAFKVTHSEDMNVFRAENLAKYDAVIFNNTTRLQMDDPAQRKGLMDFINSGKGIIGIHAATDNFYTWPEAAEMMGGQFDGHPWVGGGTWAVQIDKPDHPFNKSFAGKGFKIKEELYRSKGYSRTRVQVLVGLDFSDEATAQADGRRPTDKDVAISWIRNYGKGRVFYCSFGHNSEIYWNKAILAHYLAGIQFALGDYAIDATADVPRTLKQIAQYQEGQSRAAQYELETYIRYITGLPEEMKAYEQEMLKTLAGPITPEGRDVICRMLSLIGSEASVDALGTLLLDPQTSDVARYALERIEGERVNSLFLSGLNQAPDSVKIGIINSLGVRRCEKAVSQIAPLMSKDNNQIKTAVIEALGTIGNQQAIDILKKQNVSSDTNTLLIQDALIRAADAQTSSGKTDVASGIYRELVKSTLPSIRCASLKGLAQVDKDSVSLITNALSDPDPSVISVAITLSRSVSSPSMTQALVAALGKVDPLFQVQILAALSDRGDKSALPAVSDVARTAEGDVKIQAIRALEKLGNASIVPMLADMAAKGAPQYRGIVSETLIRIPGPNINPAIVNLLENADDNVKVVLIRALADRLVDNAVPHLLRETASNNASVASEAFKALKVLAKPDHLPLIIGRMVQTRSNNVRDEAGRTVASLSGNSCSDVLKAWAQNPSPEVKCSLIKVLGLIGSNQGLPTLQAALNDSNNNIQIEAIRALSSWPDASPLGDLLKIVDSSSNNTAVILAIRGAAGLLVKDNNKSPQEKVDLYRKLFDKTDNNDTRKQILGSLGTIGHTSGLEMACACLDDANLQSEAAQAVIDIADRVRGQNGNEAKNALNLVISKINNDNLRNKAKDVLNKIK